MKAPQIKFHRNFVFTETPTKARLNELYMEHYKPKGVKDFVQTTLAVVTAERFLRSKAFPGPGIYKVELAWYLNNRPLHIHSKLWKVI